MKKGIIYYTDNQLDNKIAFRVRELLNYSGLSIISVSLKPINFGHNIVLDLKPGIITMHKQILTALEASIDKIVFFCEHDVLYHKSHFDFNLFYDKAFYYNTNVWQWKYPKNYAVTYNNLKSLSGLCVNREFAIKHYKRRLELIEKNNWKDEKNNQQYWAKRMGFEPGTKSSRQELISNDDSECWESEYPNIDIRHKNTLTPAKMNLKDFKHQPENWREIKAFQILGWNLKKLFNV